MALKACIIVAAGIQQLGVGICYTGFRAINRGVSCGFICTPHLWVVGIRYRNAAYHVVLPILDRPNKYSVDLQYLTHVDETILSLKPYDRKAVSVARSRGARAKKRPGLATPVWLY